MTEFPKVSYETLKERLSSIPNPEHKAFLCLTYGSMARIGEIVKGKHAKNPPISKENIQITPNKLYVTLLTEKTHLTRTIPINRTQEAWITEPIIHYINSLINNILFPYSTRWAQLTFKKYFPEFKNHAHYLRHWRTTHWLNNKVPTESKKPLPLEAIRVMGGWTDLTIMTKIYSHVAIRDFEELI